MNEEVSLIYNKFCPYAHRALITAIEKDIPAKMVTTGLGEDTKTPFFYESYAKSMGRDLKSTGKVPVLIHGDKYFAESELICYYLAQAFPSGANLIPKDPTKRLKMRVWINQLNAQIIEIFERAKLQKIQDIDQFLRRVENEIEGSYLLGEEISLADLLIYPWFERWIILEHYFDRPIPADHVKIAQWLKNMNSRRSIIEAKKLTNNDYYIKRAPKAVKPKL